MHMVAAISYIQSIVVHAPPPLLFLKGGPTVYETGSYK